MKYFLFLLLTLPLIGQAQTVETIAGTGVAGYTGDGGLAKDAELNQPASVRFDHSGNMYIADWINNVIRKIKVAGIITTVAGNGFDAGTYYGGYSGDGGPATSAELSGPTDIAFDSEDNMYIADNTNDVIRKVNVDGIITTIAGTGTFGYNGDNIPATAAELNFPLGFAFDNAGNLYFADEGNSRVRKISTAGIITTIAGDGTHGYGGDGGPATAAQLRDPCWLAISSSGDLYIPDWTDHRVRKVNSLGIITTVAGNGSISYDGDGGPATSAGISGCDAIVFDALGNYFISNNVACSIRKVNSSGIISTVCGTDTCGYNGDGMLATATQINYANFCSAVDIAGNLYFADSKNNRVRRILYNATAVNNITKTQQTLTIYPNPSTNTITISAPNKIESITISNMVGQVVYSGDYNDEKVTINTVSLPAGVYMVKVNGVYAGKFVKE